MDAEATDKQTDENGQGHRDDKGRFAPGNSGGPGRPRGEPNKVGAELKGDIVTAYEQRGGIKWLHGLKDTLFVRLLEKIMPREIAADIRAVSVQARYTEHHLSEESEQLILHRLAQADGTLVLDEIEAAASAGELSTVADKLPLLEDLIARTREELRRAEKLQTLCAEKAALPGSSEAEG